jgi:hypothetical protein
MLTRLKQDRRYSKIKVCTRWLTFVNFLADMGERPAGCTLDRFPYRYGPYAPDNCRWATPHQQSRNLTNNVLIRIKCENRVLRDWLVHFGISNGAYYWRIKHGMTPIQALTTPLRFKVPTSAVAA